jgi:hypothetical protein
MELPNLSITQLAAIVGAIGTIVGAGFTIDNRYAKTSEIDSVRKELRVSLDNLHKQILENEQLKQELGNNAQAAKVLAERNRQELADIRARLNQDIVVVKKSIHKPSIVPQRIVDDQPIVVDDTNK